LLLPDEGRKMVNMQQKTDGRRQQKMQMTIDFFLDRRYNKHSGKNVHFTGLFSQSRSEDPANEQDRPLRDGQSSAVPA